jgi:hypothetical protein
MYITTMNELHTHMIILYYLLLTLKYICILTMEGLLRPSPSRLGRHLSGRRFGAFLDAEAPREVYISSMSSRRPTL